MPEIGGGEDSDIAGDYAVASQTGGDVPTVDLRIDYLRPARGNLLVTARS